MKGLSAINFTDDEANVVVFSEDVSYTQDTIARFLRRLREWIVSKHGIDEADSVVPEWQIQDLDHAAQQSLATPIFNEPKETPMATDQELAAEKAAREKAEADAATAKAELVKLQAEQEQALRKADHDKNVDFAENLVRSGSLKPADKNLIVQVLDFAEHPEHTTADFGESQSLADALKAFLKNGTTILPTGETATADRAGKSSDVSGSLNFAEFAEPNAQSHHERIVALMQKENISYEDAARRTVQ